jgi:hypothetical protein
MQLARSAGKAHMDQLVDAETGAYLILKKL